MTDFMRSATKNFFAGKLLRMDKQLAAKSKRTEFLIETVALELQSDSMDREIEVIADRCSAACYLGGDSLEKEC
jgi:hypothetical protein